MRVCATEPSRRRGLRARVIARLVAALLLALGPASSALADACCLDGGICQDLAPGDCAAQGGVPQGDGSDCAGTICVEACCFASGTCMEVAPVACTGAGGTPRGAGTDCTVNPCTQACCMDGGACVEILPTDCVAQGGIAAGEGSACVMIVCMEACCFPDASCVDLPPSECAFMSGLTQGAGSVCVSAACAPEACCLDDGTCADIPPAGCAELGGTAQGAASDCAAAGCTPAEACCIPGAGCADLIVDACSSAGGAAQGPGSACAATECAEACCLDDGTCQDVTPTDCASQAGAPQGAGTVCAAAGCPPAEACCLPGAPCEDLVPSACTAQGGASQGAGSVCAAVSCVEACCIPGQACQEIPPGDCAAQGGVAEGAGTQCAASDCPEACCFPGGACQNLPPVECVILGGTPQGKAMTCAIASCSGACCIPGPACLDGLTQEECAAQQGEYRGLESMCMDEDCRAHPGWNWIDNEITLTANEPAYWSALTGLPKGVSTFTVLDPGALPGRPAMDGTTDRVLRGYVVAWAVDEFNNEIRWNHLAGEGTIVNYRDDYSWEYRTFNHAVVSHAANGEQTGEPGVLRLDGIEYSPSFSDLLIDFQAAGSDGFSGPEGSGFLVTSDTGITLLPPSADLRQNGDGPVTTKASFDIWNQNEVKFSGTHRCITCWDQALIAQYDDPNHFLYPFLQTDHGKARIDGHAAGLCDELDDPDTPEDESVTSVPAPLLGISARLLTINGAPVAATGSNIVGMGADDTAVIRYDVTGGGGAPPEAQWPDDPAKLLDWLIGIAQGDSSEPVEPVDPAEPGKQGLGEAHDAEAVQALVGGPQDRLSATEKGSLVFFASVEIRWDADGTLVQDTFLSLTNDYPEDVRVQLYFVNGDPPLDTGP